MIVTRLTGGLGNQLFQFAVGRHLAMRRDTSLHLDLSWFSNIRETETPRVYALAAYGLDVADDGWDHISGRIAAKHGLLGRVARRSGLVGPRVLVDRDGGFRPEVLDASDGTLLIGNWQTEQYFSAIGDTIRTDFTLPGPPSARDAELLDQMRSGSSVAVHVRRTDFADGGPTQRAHGLLGNAYYQEAISTIAKHAGSLHAFVFSDEPEWCRAHLDLGHPTTVVGHHGPDEAHCDLALMTACRHHIVANSTLSWWGAWLDPDPEGFRIAPRTWVTDPRRFPDIIPAGWLII